MADQSGIDNGAGVPVTLNEVLDHIDADGYKSFELAVARAQVVKLQAERAAAVNGAAEEDDDAAEEDDGG